MDKDTVRVHFGPSGPQNKCGGSWSNGQTRANWGARTCARSTAVIAFPFFSFCDFLCFIDPTSSAVRGNLAPNTTSESPLSPPLKQHVEGGTNSKTSEFWMRRSDSSRRFDGQERSNHFVVQYIPPLIEEMRYIAVYMWERQDNEEY
jgi:hypothetical protein